MEEIKKSAHMKKSGCSGGRPRSSRRKRQAETVPVSSLLSTTKRKKAGLRLIQEKEAKDEPCRVCRLDHVGPKNDILYCDGCDMPVHQECYEVDNIPVGDWFCRACEGVTSNDEFGPSDIQPDTKHKHYALHKNPNFAMVMDFLHKFASVGLKMEPLSIENFADALMEPCANNNTTIVALYSRLLISLGRRNVSATTWEECLRKVLRDWNVQAADEIEQPEEYTTQHVRHGGLIFTEEMNSANPLDDASYDDLHIDSKLILLRALCEWQFDRNERLMAFVREDGATAEDMRQKTLGKDSKGYSYLLLEDDESFFLYRYSDSDGKHWELICSSMVQMTPLIDALARSTNSSNLGLWRRLKKDVFEVQQIKQQERERASMKSTRASRRLGSSGLDLSAIIFENVEQDDGWGQRRSGRSRKQVDYTFKKYDETLNESLRPRRDRRLEESTSRLANESYNPGKYGDRASRLRSRRAMYNDESEDDQASISGEDTFGESDSPHLKSSMEDDENTETSGSEEQEFSIPPRPTDTEYSPPVSTPSPPPSPRSIFLGEEIKNEDEQL